MTAFVDTNILIRHLTGDPPDQAARATRYLESADKLPFGRSVALGPAPARARRS